MITRECILIAVVNPMEGILPNSSHQAAASFRSPEIPPYSSSIRIPRNPCSPSAVKISSGKWWEASQYTSLKYFLFFVVVAHLSVRISNLPYG